MWSRSSGSTPTTCLRPRCGLSSTLRFHTRTHIHTHTHIHTQQEEQVEGFAQAGPLVPMNRQLSVRCWDGLGHKTRSRSQTHTLTLLTHTHSPHTHTLIHTHTHTYSLTHTHTLTYFFPLSQDKDNRVQPRATRLPEAGKSDGAADLGEAAQGRAAQSSKRPLVRAYLPACLACWHSHASFPRSPLQLCRLWRRQSTCTKEGLLEQRPGPQWVQTP